MGKRALSFCGFSIGGIDWLEADLAGADTPELRAERLCEIGYEEARLTHGLGGNLLRLFYSHATLLDRTIAVPTGGDALPFGPPHIQAALATGPWHLLPFTDKVQYLETVREGLDTQYATVAASSPTGDGLNYADIDSYLDGVGRFNRAWAKPGEEVRVLLTRVQLPPRPLIECPSKTALARAGKSWSFNDLFAAYNHIHAAIGRCTARRYSVEERFGPVVCAYEINNEPDYEWIPDELRIEHGKDGSFPLGKYVTELHNPQIGHWSDRHPPHEQAPWGGFQDQEGAWQDHMPMPAASILDYDFGVKFRWYVRCYAESARHMSYAFWVETRGSDVGVLSAGVTHCNVHYLIEMYRQDPDAFSYCTAIALHPYHWPGHDIYNREFWKDESPADWRSATPREFAFHHFKRFDFIREVHALTRKSGTESYGLEGKRLWLTEFGIPTKVLGLYNSTNSRWVPFIRPEAAGAQTIPYRSVTWESLWEGFFNDVTPDKLEKHGVDAMAFYTLRETGVPGYDKHDDDRSNFSLLQRNGLPRVSPSTFERMKRFFTGVTGANRAGQIEYKQMPPWARSKSFSTPLLRSEPWMMETLPANVAECLTMMTVDEKTLLYWATSKYFAGKGAVVDAGSFVGGSTVALAQGLMESWPDSALKLQSYDRFEADEFMRQFYFEPNGLETEGPRFRNIFDANIHSVASRVDVHDGDITTFPWAGGPIEILFIDVCKAWFIDDHVVGTFFPHLIPGQSLVIQQDFFHHWCPWLVATMEIFHDHFEFIGFARWNTGVFRCTSPVDLAKRPRVLRELPFEELETLLRRHTERYHDPYLKGILQCALIVLYKEFGRQEEAAALGSRVRSEFGAHGEVKRVLGQLGYSGEPVSA
jgi:hypothetical protein